MLSEQFFGLGRQTGRPYRWVSLFGCLLRKGALFTLMMPVNRGFSTYLDGLLDDLVTSCFHHFLHLTFLWSSCFLARRMDRPKYINTLGWPNSTYPYIRAAESSRSSSELWGRWLEGSRSTCTYVRSLTKNEKLVDPNHGKWKPDLLGGFFDALPAAVFLSLSLSLGRKWKWSSSSSKTCSSFASEQQKTVAILFGPET